MFSTGILVKLGKTFLHAALAAFIVGIAGIAAVPDLSTAKAVVLAAISGAIAAGIHAVSDAIGTAHAKRKVAP